MPTSYRQRVALEKNHRDAHPPRQAFHHPHTSFGVAGRWLKTAGILSPLIIGEFIKDPAKKWRAVRIVSLATVLLSEALWANRVKKDRESAQDCHRHEEDLESALNSATAGSTQEFAR
jgi:hypothetical protein